MFVSQSNVKTDALDERKPTYGIREYNTINIMYNPHSISLKNSIVCESAVLSYTQCVHTVLMFRGSNQWTVDRYQVTHPNLVSPKYKVNPIGFSECKNKRGK